MVGAGRAGAPAAALGARPWGAAAVGASPAAGARSRRRTGWSSTSVSRGPSSLCPMLRIDRVAGATERRSVVLRGASPVALLPGGQVSRTLALSASWDSARSRPRLALLLRRRLRRIGQRGVGGGGHQCDREDAGPRPERAVVGRGSSVDRVGRAAEGRPPAKVFGTVSMSPDWLITTSARS